MSTPNKKDEGFAFKIGMQAFPEYATFSSERKTADILAEYREQEIEAQNKALWELVGECEKQCDNMAFILNRVDTGGLHGNFESEIQQCFAKLAAIQQEKVN